MRVVELPLSFRFVNDCFVISSDDTAGFKDCKEFYEKFYHLVLGVNYAESDADFIPDDEEESKKYISGKFEEFDSKMKKLLGNKYLPNNSEE